MNRVANLIAAIETEMDVQSENEPEGGVNPEHLRMVEALLLGLLLAQQEGQVAGGTKLIFSGDTAKVYPPLLIRRLKRGHQSRHVSAFRQRC